MINNFLAINNVNPLFLNWTDGDYLTKTQENLKTYIHNHYDDLGVCLHLEKTTDLSQEEIISRVLSDVSLVRSQIHHILSTILNLEDNHSQNILDITDLFHMKFSLIVNGDPDTTTLFQTTYVDMVEHLQSIKNTILSKYSTTGKRDQHFYDHMWFVWGQHRVDHSVIDSLYKHKTGQLLKPFQYEPRVRKHVHGLMKNMIWEDIIGVRHVIDYFFRDKGYVVETQNSILQ